MNVTTWLKIPSYAVAYVLFIGAIMLAYSQVSITPNVIEMESIKGSKKSFSLLIRNNSTDTLREQYTLTIENMNVSDDGMPRPVSDNPYRGCSSWISVDTTKFALAGGQSINLKGIIKIPPDVDGGYYAFIGVTDIGNIEKARPLKDRNIDIGVQPKVKFGAVLLLNVKSRMNNCDLSIDSLAFIQSDSARRGLEQAAWACNIYIKNKGNTHTVIKGKATLWTANMQRYDKSDLIGGMGYILPEKIRTFQANFVNAPVDGTYLISAFVMAKSGKSYHKEFPIFVYNGRAAVGEPDEKLKNLMELLSPPFALKEHFKEYYIEAKGKTAGHIEITNTTKKSLTLIPRYLQWGLDISGNLVFSSDAVQGPRSCTSWLSLNRNKITLAPNEHKQIGFTIIAPDTLEGEYFGAVCFDKDSLWGNVSADFILQRTYLVSAKSKKSSVPKAIFQEVKSLSPKEGGRKFLIAIKNEGNCKCDISGRVNILKENYDRMGDPISFGGQGSWVLPGAYRAFEVGWEGKLPPGKYVADITMTYVENGDEVRHLHNFVVK